MILVLSFLFILSVCIGAVLLWGFNHFKIHIDTINDKIKTIETNIMTMDKKIETLQYIKKDCEKHDIVMFIETENEHNTTYTYPLFDEKELEELHDFLIETKCDDYAHYMTMTEIYGTKYSKKIHWISKYINFYLGNIAWVKNYQNHLIHEKDSTKPLLDIHGLLDVKYVDIKLSYLSKVKKWDIHDYEYNKVKNGNRTSYILTIKYKEHNTNVWYRYYSSNSIRSGSLSKWKNTPVDKTSDTILTGKGHDYTTGNIYNIFSVKQ